MLCVNGKVDESGQIRLLTFGENSAMNPLGTEYAPRAIFPILLVKRSLVPYGALLTPLSIVFYYYFKRKTQKIWFCS
jgi:hypothetical protein